MAILIFVIFVGGKKSKQQMNNKHISRQKNVHALEKVENKKKYQFV